MMQGIRQAARRRPVAWFFALSFVLYVAVVAVLLVSGAGAVAEEAVETYWDGQQRTDFVSAYRLAMEAPQAIPGIALSILQPLTPDIAAFVVAGGGCGVGGSCSLLPSPCRSPRRASTTCSLLPAASSG